MFQFQPEKARWFSEPRRYEIQPDRVIITTDPGSDFWQRTYYGFQNDNAHVLLNSTKEPYFSFTVKASFQSSTLFDQCGLAIYQNSGSWAKACIEYHDAKESWLGNQPWLLRLVYIGDFFFCYQCVLPFEPQGKRFLL